MSVEWIETDEALVDLCAHLREQPWIAVDTEFHRERTYFAQLALVQVASTERVACVDPLAELDLAPLDELMLDEGVLKVFHAGRQDLEIFFDRTRTVPGPVFDTQIAAGLLGLGDQLGYAALVGQVTGARLKKLHGRTDWMRRPLDKGVVEYAADDVRYLREVFAKLDEDLRGLGRREWLDEEQAHLMEADTYRVPTDEVWKRVKGAGRLKGVETAVAQAVAAWRESRARKVDRPRRRVLTDEVVVDLARQKPKNVGALERMRALDAGARKRHGEALIRVVKEAVESPEDTWPESLDRGRGAPFDAALVDALAAVLQARAKEADISPRILAARGDLERLAAGERDLAVLRGWRGTLAGDALIAFLEGKLRLEVAEGALRVSPVG
jgi:ribonuclease D